MFRTCLLKCKLTNGLKNCRTYLSANYQNVANKGFEVTANYRDVDQLLALRWKRLKEPELLESSNYAVIGYFLKTGTSDDDLISILANRLQYGVFLNDFTSCYLMDLFLKKENNSAAAQIVKELIAIERLNGDLVCALALKSCFEYVKTHDWNVPTEETKSGDEIKVRVKYLPPPPTPEDQFYEPKLTRDVVGRCALKLAEKYDNELQSNIKLIGLLLCKEYTKALELLKTKGNQLFTDTLKVSTSLASKEENAELQEILASIEDKIATKTSTYADKLNDIIKTALDKDEEILIKSQNEKFPIWHEKWQQENQRETEERTKEQRKIAIEKVLKEIEERKQKLWFFELEDKLDLEIYNKIPRYPKRWFGKKKKPKVVDEDYVPPEIVRK